MPAPLAPIAYAGGVAVARYVAKHGVKKAAEKYGKAALKRVATKKTAKSAATKSAIISGEGAADAEGRVRDASDAVRRRQDG